MSENTERWELIGRWDKEADTERMRENRLRRRAQRQGLMLQKSRRRNPLALDYGGYWLVDVQHNLVVAGGQGSGYALDLDAVEMFLAQEDKGAE